MNNTRSKLRTVTLGIVLVALGAVAGWWWAQYVAAQRPDVTDAIGATSGAERRVLYWYDPMSPQHHFDQPGKSPFMDMELVPKYADNDSTEDVTPTDVKIDAQLAQNIGMRQAVVERIALESVVEATGLIAFNERDVTLEQVRSSGLVERVWPLAPGDVIEAGQPLAEVLVPEWSAAQAELLVLRASADPDLVEAARQRLRQLGMSVASIEELERTGRARQSFILKSSRAGLLESLDVRSGMSLVAGQTLARIQGIGSVWLEVAVPESRAAAVAAGSRAQVQLAAYPGRTYNGQVTAVLPALDTATRTLRVRIELPNPLDELRAGMSAGVRIVSGEDKHALAVPTEAIIRTGKRALVMLVQGAAKYAPVEVELGREINDRTVIVAGLQEGQKIVSSAQFLFDSEASLSGVVTRAADSPATTVPVPAAHSHSPNGSTGARP